MYGKQMQLRQKKITVFAKQDFAMGNQALVLFADDFLVINDAVISAELEGYFSQHKKPARLTLCFAYCSNSDNFIVRCFNKSHEIQCCGHGMIAAAKTVFHETKKSFINLNENMVAQYEAETDTVLVKLPRLSALDKTVPVWVKEIAFIGEHPVSPVRAASSKAEDGYLLLHLQADTSLQDFSALEMDHNKICENTKQAIVIIVFYEKEKQLLMRYFAPQYGIPEDTATGSVMRFVSDYIEKHYRISRFEVIQCSAKGGYMEIDCHTDNVIIKANARIESSE